MADDPEIKSKIRFKAEGLDKVKGEVGGLAQDIAALMAAMLAGGNKFKNLMGGLGSVIVGRVLGPLGLVSGALFGVLGAMKLIVQQSQLLARGLETVSKLEFLEKQFLPLVKGAALAKERIKELFVFAATTPFQLPAIVEASRLLEVLTKGALSTGQQLRMIGDAAAIAGRPLQEVAMWVGRLYDALQSGAPIGEPLARLQEMGLVSGQTRRQIEQLTASGAQFSQVWATIEAELSKAKGGMEQLSQTLGGLETTLADARAAMAAAFAEPFLEAEKDSIRNSIQLFQSFTPVVAHLGQIIAAAQSPFTKLKALVVQSGPAMQALSAGAIAATNAFLLFTAAITATQLKVVIFSIYNFTRAILAKAAATRMSTAATLEATVAENLNAIATNRGTTAKVAATVATKAFSGAMGFLRGALSFVATTAKGAWAALAANPLIAIGAALTAAIGIAYVKLQEQARAVRELRQANAEARASIQDQIKDMQTVADKAETLAAAYNRLAEARRKLTELRDNGASAREIETQRAAVFQAEADAKRVESTGGLSPAEKSLEAKRAELELAEKIRDIIFQSELARLNAAEQSLKLSKEQEALARRIAEAENRKAAQESASPTLAGLRAQREALKAELEENNARLAGPDLEYRRTDLTGEQALALAPVDKQRIAERNRAILQEAKALNAQITAIESDSAIGLATQRDIDNLDELKSKAEQYHQQQLDIAQRRDDAIEQAEQLLAVQSKLNEASQAAVAGDTARSAALRDEAREMERQIQIKARINELQRQGVELSKAEAQAQQEAAASEEKRTLRQDLFLQNRMLDIEAQEAENLGTQQGDERARQLRDLQKFQAVTGELIKRGGLSPAKAEEMAFRQLGADFSGVSQQGSRVSADSYRQLGLGGNARGSDPLLASAQRREDLLRQAVELLKTNQTNLGVN